MAEKTTPTTEHIGESLIEREMRESYLTYALSVIHDRALPDVRDGLKPSQRRILVAMHDLNLRPNSKYRKCAKIAGDTSGNYHPHGESVIYPTLVRMAQPFRLRSPLVDGQGNFGSIDGDPPAAMRYTEARLAGPAEEMLVDIDKETVDKKTNYDETRLEPTVLPGRFPNLLVNGSEGIAVGMSTALPPHNPSEVLRAIRMVLDQPECTAADIMEIMPGPDFPTGGIICGREGIVSAYTMGQGRITLRARMHHEEPEGRGREKLVVTEIPYEREKAAIIMKIADAVKDERITGIHDIRDESDRTGMRMVIELKKDADPAVVENMLYKHSALQTTYSIRNTVLIDGQPKQVGVKTLLLAYKDHRFEVMRRRTAFLLEKAETRLHILEGLMIAIQAIDEVVEIVKTSKDTSEAKARLEAQFQLTERQSQAIVDMRLGRLTGLEVHKLQEEIDQLKEDIAWYNRLLTEDELINNLIREDLDDMEAKYGNPRVTEIGGSVHEFLTEDLITEETVVVTITRSGRAKRTPADTYRAQARGGRGITGGKSKEGDTVSQLFVCSTHDYLLIVTDRGRLYWLKVFRLPDLDRTAQGRSIRNLIEGIEPDEEIRSIRATRDFTEAEYLLFATEKGKIKKTELSAYARPRRAGIIATKLEEGDRLIGTRFVSEGDEVMLCTAGGKVVRFKESDARPMGRAAAGVRGAALREGDRVVALVAGTESELLLVACENGYGKRTRIGEFRLTKRGSQGVVGIKTSDRNGPVVNALNASRCDDVLFMTQSGMMVRTEVNDISTQGRATQGVRLVNLKDGDQLVRMAPVVRDEEEKEEPVGASAEGKSDE
ncbi:MAG: DNA gyrase subunit A [Planctomycetota bacterium]|jgi:DNA gyrase subunit A|nr:DNA gyrase subunit A [Planctomycetota bacterium]|tara:strand:+ start:15265 stop:17760 length:2496 start_codon:yes stop_codon:yes gene_type:complete